MEEHSQFEAEASASGPVLVPVGVHAGRPGVPLYRMTVIGAHESMHLRLVAPQISRAHAVVLNCDGGVFLHDLNSRDGVRLNGRAVLEAELAEGDVVGVGPFSFRLEMNEGPHQHRVRRRPRPVQLVLEEGEPMPLDRRVLVIGQRRGCDLRLKDPMVATVHAAILNANGRHYIRDLGSHNGTLVNGRPVRHAKLRPGDVIRIGKCILRYVRVDGEPVIAPVEDERASLFAAARPETLAVEEDWPVAAVVEEAVAPAMEIAVEPLPLAIPEEVGISEPGDEMEPPAGEVIAIETHDAAVPAETEAVEPETPVYAGPFDGASTVVEVLADAEPAVVEEPAGWFDGAAVGWTAMAHSPDEPELMGMAVGGEMELPADDPEVTELPELAGLELAAELETAASPAEPEAITIIGTALAPLLPQHADDAGDRWAVASSSLAGAELVLDSLGAVDLESENGGVVELPGLARVEFFANEAEPPAMESDAADDEVLPGVPASALPAPVELEEEPEPPAAAGAGEAAPAIEAVELPGLAVVVIDADPEPLVPAADAEEPQPAEAPEEPAMAALAEASDEPELEAVPADTPAALPKPPRVEMPAPPAADSSTMEDLPQVSKLIALAFTGRPMTGKRAGEAARSNSATAPMAAPVPPKWRRTPVLLGLGGLVATAAAVVWLLLKDHL